MALQQQGAVSPLPAQMVANSFVQHYYYMLHHSPELVYLLYEDKSNLGRSEADSMVNPLTTMEAINKKILSLNCGGCKTEIKTVDAQDSLNSGVLVLVTGLLTGKDDFKRNFSQSFFLATNKTGYFVLNDIFRFTDDAKNHEGNQVFFNVLVEPLVPKQEQTPAPEPEVPEQTCSPSKEKIDDAVLCEPKAVSAINELADEIQSGLQMSSDSCTIVQEMPKKSYASIVKVMKEKQTSSLVPASASVKSLPSNSEPQVAQSLVSLPAAEAPALNPNNNESAKIPEAEDSHSIYINNLPMNITPAQVEEEFKRFGPIKSGGVQVRSNKAGFCFGFVEFEMASAVQGAIEASPITIGGRQTCVEEKRSVSRVGNRGRFQSGRGGGGFKIEEHGWRNGSNGSSYRSGSSARSPHLRGVNGNSKSSGFISSRNGSSGRRGAFSAEGGGRGAMRHQRTSYPLDRLPRDSDSAAAPPTLNSAMEAAARSGMRAPQVSATA